MVIKRPNRITLVCCAAAFLYSSGATYAGDNVVNFSGRVPSEKEIIDALMPQARALNPGAIAAQKIITDQITFDLNSDWINPKSKVMLHRLGNALASNRLDKVRFVVEGHTDATGSLPYNMRLSERRAESVKRYLLEAHRIAPERIKSEGKGPTDLLDPTHPNSGINRRVVVIAGESK